MAAHAQTGEQTEPLPHDIPVELSGLTLDELTRGGNISKETAKEQSGNNATVIDRALWSLPSMRVDGWGSYEKLRVDASVQTLDIPTMPAAQAHTVWSRHPLGSILPWYPVGERPHPTRRERVQELLVTPRTDETSDFRHRVPMSESGYVGPSWESTYPRQYAVASVNRDELAALRNRETERLDALAANSRLGDNVSPTISSYTDGNALVQPRRFHAASPNRILAAEASGSIVIMGQVERTLDDETGLTDRLMEAFDVPTRLGKLVADFGKSYTL